MENKPRRGEGGEARGGGGSCLPTSACSYVQLSGSNLFPIFQEQEEAAEPIVLRSRAWGGSHYVLFVTAYFPALPVVKSRPLEPKKCLP